MPTNHQSIPLGVVKDTADTADTAFDIFVETPLSKALEREDEELNNKSGYDHCFVFDAHQTDVMKMATLRDEESGRLLSVSSNAPGLQFYTSNFLDANIRGKNSIPFKKYGAVCLEPQQLPNAPNEKHFPSPIIEAGAAYHHKITYDFGVK